MKKMSFKRWLKYAAEDAGVTTKEYFEMLGLGGKEYAYELLASGDDLEELKKEVALLLQKRKLKREANLLLQKEKLRV